MNRLSPLRDGRRRLSFDVGDAQAAADAAFREPVLDHERDEGGDLLDEGRGFEDLAADVRVNSDELQLRQVAESFHRFGGRARCQ